jgi:hypothetical protein
MFATLIQSVGVWFLIACAIEALAVFVEQAGAVRSPEEDEPRTRASALIALLLSLITPGLLLAHGFLVTQAQDQTSRVLAMAVPIVAVLAGALLGAIAGAMARAAAPVMRTVAMPFDLMAFGAAIYATLPTIRVLIEAAQNNGVIVAP